MKPINEWDQKKLAVKIEKAFFFACLILVGGAYVLFYRRYLPYSWDGGYHTLFAKKLFQQSLESMAAEEFTTLLIRYIIYA